MTILVSVIKSDTGYEIGASSHGVADLPKLDGLNTEQVHTALANLGAKIVFHKIGGEDPIEGLYALPIK